MTATSETRADTPTDGCDTLVDHLVRNAALRAERPAVTFLDFAQERDGVATTLTYAELDRRARALAAALRRAVGDGGRVAILCPHEPAYVVAFLACLYAGRVGLPLFAPHPYRSNERLRPVVEDADPSCVLATSATAADVHEVLAGELGLERYAARLLAVDEVPEAAGRGWEPAPADPEALAYLQYTSGSTRNPAGVEITHRNLAVAAAQMAETSEFTADSVVVSWLPFFHDLGLVSAIAMPLMLGAHAVHLSPYAFVKQPERWLRAISDYRARWSAAPDFGFELCARRIPPERAATLDLRCLDVIVNGGEPVRPTCIERFAEVFAPAGLRPTAHAPGYGLAEATLGVTASLVHSPAVHGFDREALARGVVRPVAGEGPEVRRIVGCGPPMRGIELRIVDPDRHTAAPADRVGEIWVRGPNVARGYWRQPERTAAVFGARLRAEDGAALPGTWLRTGDLGFVHDGYLYVTGRIKDLVIIGGRNHDPSDIEFAVEPAHPDLGPGRVAAFSVDPDAAAPDGSERLVVVVEVRRSTIAGDGGDALVRRVRAAVAAEHDLDCHDVVLVRRGTIPKTSSGKVRRAACRRRYLDGDLEPAGGAA